MHVGSQLSRTFTVGSANSRKRSVRIMIDSRSNQHVNNNDPAHQYNYLLDNYAKLSSGDVVFIWARVCEIIILADEASHVVIF